MYKQVSIRANTVGKHIMCLLGVIKKLHMKHIPIRRQFFKIERNCSLSSLQRCHLKMSWLGLTQVQNFSRFGNQNQHILWGCSCSCIQQPGCLLVRKLEIGVSCLLWCLPQFSHALGEFTELELLELLPVWELANQVRTQATNTHAHTPALLSHSEGNTLLHMFVPF